MGGIADAILDVSDPAGFFSGLSGKTAAEGAERALQEQRAAAELQRQAVDRAREEIFGITPLAQEAIREGFQGGLDVFSGAIPAQIDVMQQGNVGSQQALIGGLPQFQNAILGTGVDFSQMQPFQVQTPDLSFLQRQLPQQVSMEEVGPIVTTPSVGNDFNNPSDFGGFGKFIK